MGRKSLLDVEEPMKSGDGEDIADFIVDVAELQKASLGLYILEETEENAESGAADIFESSAVKYDFPVGLIAKGAQALFAFVGLEGVEASGEGHEDVAVGISDIDFHK